MSKERGMSLSEVESKIEWEGGIGEAIHYFGPDPNFADKKLKALWKKAYIAVTAIEDYLGEE